MAATRHGSLRWSKPRTSPRSYLSKRASGGAFRLLITLIWPGSTAPGRSSTRHSPTPEASLQPPPSGQRPKPASAAPRRRVVIAGRAGSQPGGADPPHLDAADTNCVSGSIGTAVGAGERPDPENRVPGDVEMAEGHLQIGEG